MHLFSVMGLLEAKLLVFPKGEPTHILKTNYSLRSQLNFLFGTSLAQASLARSVPNKKPRCLRIRILSICAEEEGFEPPVPCGTTVFKTAAFDHSAIPPGAKLVKKCKVKVQSVKIFT